MKGKTRLVWGAVLFAVLLSAGIAYAGTESTGERRVTADLRKADIHDALKLIFRDTGYSYTLSLGMMHPGPVTASLSNVEFTKALGLVCDAAGLIYKREGDAFVILPREEVAVIDGRRVPVLGATWIKQLGKHLEASPPESVIAGGPGALPHPVGGGAGQADLPPPAGRHTVDLVVRDLPIRETIAQFAKASGADVVVHDAVPKDIRVTAKAYLVDAWWLLKAIADQANLAIQIEPVLWSPEEEKALEEEQKTGRPRPWPNIIGGIVPITRDTKTFRYHLVPRVELKVTGPGVPGPGPSGPSVMRVPPGLEFLPHPPSGSFLPLGDPPAPSAEVD